MRKRKGRKKLKIVTDLRKEDIKKNGTGTADDTLVFESWESAENHGMMMTVHHVLIYCWHFIALK